MKQLRTEAKKLVNELSDDQLRVAVSFMEFLDDHERWEATREILASPELVREHRQGVRDMENGKGTPWRKVRSDV